MQPSSAWVGSTSALNASSASDSLPSRAVNAPTTTTSDMRSSLLFRGAHRTRSGRLGGMRVSGRINHVSVNARDLEESVDFYVDLLGAERIATPNFGLPVQWLA